MKIWFRDWLPWLTAVALMGYFAFRSNQLNKTIARLEAEKNIYKAKAELYDSLVVKVKEWSKPKHWPDTLKTTPMKRKE